MAVDVNQGLPEQDVDFGGSRASTYIGEENMRGQKLILMREGTIERNIEIEYIRVKGELMWLKIRSIWRF